MAPVFLFEQLGTADPTKQNPDRQGGHVVYFSASLTVGVLLGGLDHAATPHC
jgi:hypothetical protein